MPAEETEETPDSVFWTAISVELGLGVLALLLGWLTNVDVRQWIPRPERAELANIFGGIGLGMLAALPMLLLVAVLERIDWKPLRELKSLEDLPVVSALLNLSRLELVAISIAAGIGEELLVRGWLMGWIIGPAGDASAFTIAVAVVISSVVFGLMHPISVAYTVVAALMGLFFAGILVWSGNLLVPIAAHATYDAVHLLLSKRQQEREKQRPKASPEAQSDA
jgi:uncharacterized protein